MKQIKGIISSILLALVLTVGGSYVLNEFFDMPTAVSEFLGF